MQAQKHLQNANYELSVKESATRGVGAEVGSRVMGQGVGIKNRFRAEEEGVGKGCGGRECARESELRVGAWDEQKAGAEYGNKGCEQGVGRSKIWQMAMGEQKLGIAGGSRAEGGSWG
jgi:hypothetical protein